MKKLSFLIVVLSLFGLNEALGQWGTNGTHIYNSNSGNVGIGTNSPGYLLHVSKNMTSPSVRIQNFGGIGGASFDMVDSFSGANWKFKATNAGGFKIRDHANGMDVFQIEPNSIANAIYIESGGNIGIHTAIPNSLFQVQCDASNFVKLGNNPTDMNIFYHTQLTSNGDGQSGLYTKRNRDTRNDGTGYTDDGSNVAIKAYNFYGDNYSFGIAGFNDNDYYRCGGVLGKQSYNSIWGSLGYKNSGGNSYGGYFTSNTGGSGKSKQTAKIGIGIGAWGDLFGADIHGNIYGVFAEGGNYALFTNGTVYNNGLEVHLQENGTKTKTVLYTYVSTDVSVQTRGTATLTDGSASIVFDPAFSAAVSASESIVVTVTPTGNSNGVFLSEVSSSGFTVVENNAGRSNIAVNFIAIGTRSGYENPSLAKEVIDAEYTSKIARGLHNDSDTQTDGEGLYYENGQLVVGIHPSTLPDPHKPDKSTEKLDRR